MASTPLEKVSADLRTARFVVHNLGETFNSFQVHSCSIFNLVEQWRNLQSSFADVHNTLESRVKELECKEREIGNVANELRNFRNAVELKHKRLEVGENSLSEKIKEVGLRQNDVKKWLELIEVEKRRIVERKKAVEVKEMELVEGLERVRKVDDDEIRVKKLKLEEIRVKKVAEELESREKLIDERCKVVELRENRVDERCRTVGLREDQVEERRKELELRENQVDERCKELDLRESESVERQELLEGKEMRLDEQRRELGVNENRLIKDRLALELREREMDDLYSLLELRENEISERFTRVESREKELKLREEELKVQDEECKSKEKDVTERFDVLAVKEKSFSEDRRALQEKENEINERFANLVVREEEVNKQSRDVQLKEMQVNAQCIVVESKERVFNDQWEMLELKGKEVDERSKAVELKGKEVDERSKAVELKEKEVGELRQGVDERSKAVELKEKEVGELRRGVDLKESQVNEGLQGLQSKQKEIDEHLKEMEVKEKEISERCREMKVKEKQINRRKKALELIEKQFEEASKVLQLKEKEVSDCYQVLEQKEKQLTDLPQLLELQEEHCKVLSEVEHSKEKQLNEPSKATVSMQQEINELSRGWELTEKKINEQFVCDHDKGSDIKQKDINVPLVATELNGNQENPHNETQERSTEQKKVCSEEMRVKGKHMVDEAVDLKLTQIINLQKMPVFEDERQVDIAHKSSDTRNAELNEAVCLKKNQVPETTRNHEVGKTQLQKTDSNLAVNGNGNQGGASTFQAMDGKSFQLYLNERFNKHGSMKGEVIRWLKSASDPGKLVLEAIDGFFAPHMSKDGVAFEASVVRSSCLLLLEHLMNMKPEISKALRKEATMVSIKWRAKMMVQGENEVIALAFFMLLITYNLTNIGNKDDHRRLCGMIDKHRLGPRLRQKLGLLKRTNVSSDTENGTKEPIQMESLLVTNAADSSSVKIPGDIHSLCKSMDGQGVRLYLLEHAKEYNVFHDKILDALRYALDPAKLVLNVCHVSVTDTEKNRAYVNTTLCTFLLKQLMKLSPSISLEVSNEAKNVADFLKSRLKGSSIPADYHRFLQFIASYKLANSYNADELLSYFKIFYSRDEVYMPEENAHLCRALGLAKKIPGIIKSLIGQQKLLLAVKYICVFKLEHSFQSVPLLEAHLESVNRTVDEKRKKGNFKDKIDAEHLELMTLKSILTCISNFKLESKLPPDRFISRIKELEEEKERRMGKKGGRKRGSSPRPCIATPLQQEKRPRLGTAQPSQPVSPVPYPPRPPPRRKCYY